TPPEADWTMVHAIARQESEFDRNRVSHAGAAGLMQLMPGTAREQAGRLGIAYMSASIMPDTQYNIRLGNSYVQRMMNSYGSYPLAVAAYNAGPGNVNKWLRQNGDPRTGAVSWIDWIERIPFFETKNYVARVLENAATYEALHPDKAALGRPRTISEVLREGPRRPPPEGEGRLNGPAFTDSPSSMPPRENLITPAGLAALKARYDHLLGTERPEIVAIVSWAAGNGDRSENGDYLYGRKRMREIDRELAHLARRMKAARVLDPARAPDKTRAWFGATVTIAPVDSGSDDTEHTLTLVGDDEQDTAAGRIGWSAPLARALRGAAVGDLRTVRLPAGEKE